MDNQRYIGYLNAAVSNGCEPRYTVDQLLGLQPPPTFNDPHDQSNGNERIGACLNMGRGRRFVCTTGGRLAPAPAVDTMSRERQGKGSAIAILHECSVPIVLNVTNEERGEYKIVGDAYVAGIMHGEAVDWIEEHAQVFIII